MCGHFFNQIINIKLSNEFKKQLTNNANFYLIMENDI